MWSTAYSSDQLGSTKGELSLKHSQDYQGKGKPGSKNDICLSKIVREDVDCGFSWVFFPL